MKRYLILILSLTLLTGCNSTKQTPTILPQTQTQNCTIKGNVSYNSQEKIYHIPGCENYADVTINTDYGERWFCSEQEAVNAGWRKAYNCP